MTREHTIDSQIRAVRMGWLPSYPQFNRSPLELVKQAEQEGAKTDVDMVVNVNFRMDTTALYSDIVLPSGMKKTT